MTHTHCIHVNKFGELVIVVVHRNWMDVKQFRRSKTTFNCQNNRASWTRISQLCRWKMNQNESFCLAAGISAWYCVPFAWCGSFFFIRSFYFCSTQCTVHSNCIHLMADEIFTTNYCSAFSHKQQFLLFADKRVYRILNIHFCGQNYSPTRKKKNKTKRPHQACCLIWIKVISAFDTDWNGKLCELKQTWYFWICVNLQQSRGLAPFQMEINKSYKVAGNQSHDKQLRTNGKP